MSQYLKRIEISNVGNVEEEIQSHYLKRVHVVEVVDSDGNPWEPVPGPDPWDELVLVSDPTLSGEPLVGSTLTMTPGVFTGGSDQQYRDDHLQVSNDGQGAWSWLKQNITHQLTSNEAGKFLRGVSYVYDGDNIVSGFSNVVGPVNYVEWGDITTEINDQSYDAEQDGAYPCAANTPQHCVVSVANAPSDLTYEWSRRGNDNVLIGTPTNHTTTITFPEAGVFTITVTLKSNLTEAWESAILSFMVA